MTPQEAVEVVERQLAATRLAWAEAMRVAGRGNEAEAALAVLGDKPEALDLRARIALQRGAEAKAAEFWQRILDRDPAHVGALEGQALLARHQRQRAQYRRAARVTAIIAGVAAAAATLLLSWNSAH